jgi:hypothetical protein
MKKSSEIEAVQAELQRDIDRWNEIRRNGCNDPFWPDGVNLNLKRNHIIYDLRRIADLEQKPVQMSVLMVLDPIHNSVDDVMGDGRIPPRMPDDFMVHDRFDKGRRVRIDVIHK